MDVKLPLVVTHPGRRLVEAWVPGLDGVHGVGPSLSELRDDLALKVMERFEAGPATRLGAFQLPPHVFLRMLDVETVAYDKPARKRWTLEGRMGVLVEKWPGETYWVVTPTRLASARFALRSLDDLPHAMNRRMAAWAVDRRLLSLDDWASPRRERLDILEVDADPPPIFPKGWHRFHVPGRKRKDTKDAKDAARKIGEPSREERRAQRRFTVRTLREIARNLSHAARDDSLDRAFGREAVVRALLEEFELREGNAVCLVGASGSGKTAIVHELVRRMAAKQTAQGTRRDVWRVDGNRFIAGMMYVGQWEARARELIEELVDLGDVLYVDDLASMVYAGRTRSGDTNVARFMEPHLARGELTVIAECTPERFEKVREEEPGFASLFRVVHVDALDDRATLPVLLGVLRDLEGDTLDGAPALRVSPEALETVLTLTRRFFAHEAFPGKAVRLLKAVLAGPGELRDNQRWYARADVFATFQRQTGLPDFILGAGGHKTRDDVARGIEAMVVGQPDAVDAVADVVVLMQHGLADPEKPMATYLFVGPTGVGKTETAKALATWLFGSSARLVRFDMSEFGSPSAISRLVGHTGAPDGELTLALRTQPFCVVLFDEIEKAHPRVFDALLQLLGEGRLTDAAGRLADARQAVILMTSNLGVKEASQRTGFARDGGDARVHYTAAARRFFRPEFFNRIDRVVPFGPLSREALRVVVEHALGQLLSRRGIVRGNVLVDVEPELLDALVEQAWDPRYGARPLRRALERELAVPLAHHLVRRQSHDLSLVDLYRAADGMRLTVRSLRNAPPVAVSTDLSTWTADTVSDRVAELRERIDAIAASPLYDRLADARAEALRAMQRNRQTPVSPGVELLERLAELRDALDRVEERDPRSDRFIEDTHNAPMEIPHTWRLGTIVRGPTVRVYETVTQEGFVVQSLGPEVARLLEALEVLEHQIARAEQTVERVTVLLEPSSNRDRRWSGLVTAACARAVPAFIGRVTSWREVEEDGELRWEPDEGDSALPVERRSLAVAGVGVRDLLAAVEGHALFRLRGKAGAVDESVVLVAVRVLDSDDVAAAVGAHDKRTRSAREARRAGEAGESHEVATVTLRGSIDQEQGKATLEHVATGLPADRADAIAAAVLRAAKGG
ncbi:MAG: AAA family ATPase [Polyangiales bacterium]